ncbi:MAG: hypothetical protein ACHQZS_10580 [Candidatus Binatales bacterium]
MGSNQAAREGRDGKMVQGAGRPSSQRSPAEPVCPHVNSPGFAFHPIFRLASSLEISPKISISWRMWLKEVGIPYLALIAITVIEGLAPWPTFFRKGIELGIDACILGLGVSGASLAGNGISSKLGADAVGVAVALILLDIIILGVCLHQRDGVLLSERARMRLSIFMGVLMLLINSGIVLTWG